MQDMLEKVVNYGWDHEDCDDCEEGITETCMTYTDLAVLFQNLLEWGNGKFDDRAVAFLAEMVGEYICDEGPQPPAGHPCWNSWK